MILDLIGTLIWVAAIVLVGFYFHTELELIALKAAEAGLIAGLILGGIIVAVLLLQGDYPAEIFAFTAHEKANARRCPAANQGGR